MSNPMIDQILMAERELGEALDAGAHPHDTHASVREASANLIRSSANAGLHLADRLDHARRVQGAVDVAGQGA